MNLEAIQEAWDIDCKIDRLNLGDESLKSPKLQSKYYKIFINEVLQLRKQELDLKILKAEKLEFFVQGPSRETEEKGWKLPHSGKILKVDASNYVDVDSDVVKQTLKLAVQKEKVTFVESILKEIANRSFHISNCIKYEVFKAGG